jgi:quercetin dioxygenase-like cupin family protein
VQESIQNQFREISSGVFTRTVYRTAPDATPKVEVRDLEIAPGKTLERLALPGAAVLEVRSGRASARVGPATRQVQTGAVLAVSEGEALGLDNRGDVPLSVRLYVIGAK